MTAEGAHDGVTLMFCQRRLSPLTHETLHLRQDFLPFHHGAEPRIRHPMASHMWHTVASPTTCPVLAPCHFLPIEMDKGLKGRKVVGILLFGPDP